MLDKVPDSDLVGAAFEGTNSPSISGRPDPDTSMKSVLVSCSIISTMVSLMIPALE
jgi:hypothetical protein